MSKCVGRMTSAATVSNIISDNKEVSNASSVVGTFNWRNTFENDEEVQGLIDTKSGSLVIEDEKKNFTGSPCQCKIAMNIVDAYSAEEKANFCREVEKMSAEERKDMRRFIVWVNGVFSGTSWSWYLEYRSSM